MSRAPHLVEGGASLSPPASEAAVTPEKLAITVGIAELPLEQRRAYKEYPGNAEQKQRHQNRYPAMGTATLSGENGAYMASHQSLGFHQPVKEALANTVASSLQIGFEGATFDGLTNDEVHAAVEGIAEKIQDDLASQESVNAAVVRLFTGADGSKKAVVYNTGDATIIQRHKDEEGQEITTLTDFPNPFGGERNSHDRNEVTIVNVRPNDRFILANRGMRDAEGYSIEGVAETVESLKDAGSAARALTKLPEVLRDAYPSFKPNMSDMSVTVIDVMNSSAASTAATTESKFSKMRNAVLKPLASAHLGSTERKAERSARLGRAIDRYKNDPKFHNLVNLIGVGAVVAAASTTGIMLASRAGGISEHFAFGLFDHGGDGGTTLHDGALHTAADSSSYAPSESPSVEPSFEPSGASPSTSTPELFPTTSGSNGAGFLPETSGSATVDPSVSSATPTASPHASSFFTPSATPTHSASPSPSAAHTSSSPRAETSATTASHTGNGHPHTANPNNSSTAPENIHLSPEDAQWAKATTGGGKIGEYHSTGAAPTDGTWRPGTAGHTALDGLNKLGYDVNKLSETDKHQYIDHVLHLKSNGNLSWEDARHLSSNRVIHNPTNGGAIATITEITAKNHGGHAILPDASSPAGQHLAHTQATTGAGANTNNQPHNRGGYEPNMGNRNANNNAAPTPTTTAAHNNPTTSPAPSTPSTTTPAPIVSHENGDSTAWVPWAIVAGAGSVGVTAAFKPVKNSIKKQYQKRKKKGASPPKPIVGTVLPPTPPPSSAPRPATPPTP